MTSTPSSPRSRTSGPTLVYYGGEYPAGAPLSQQLKEAASRSPSSAATACSAPTTSSCNKKAEGDIASSVGEPVEALDSAKKFIDDYKAAGYKDAYEAYGGYTYDATWAIIQAVKAVVDDNDGKLPATTPASRSSTPCRKVKFDGVTGPVAFDEYGDTTNTQITAYQVDKGKWALPLQRPALQEARPELTARTTPSPRAARGRTSAPARSVVPDRPTPTTEALR